MTVLGEGLRTPAPWINVIANPSFGFLVSESGSGYTWSGNSHENQLTPWSNDPVTDPPGEAIYIRDEDTGVVWSPTALPVRDEASVVCRAGTARATAGSRMARKEFWRSCCSSFRFKTRSRSRAWFCKIVRRVPAASRSRHLRNGCWEIRAARRRRTLSRNSIAQTKRSACAQRVGRRVRRARCLSRSRRTAEFLVGRPYGISRSQRRDRAACGACSEAARFREEWVPASIRAPRCKP